MNPLSEIKRGYRGVCEQYANELAALYAEGYSFRRISDIIAENYKVRIRPESISKFLARNSDIVIVAGEVKITPMLGVVGPKSVEESWSHDLEIDPTTNDDTDRQILVELGFDPDSYFIRGVKLWGREGSFNKSYNIQRRPDAEPEVAPNEEVSLQLLFSEASKNLGTRRPFAGPLNHTANCVLWADPQTGKVDKRGGVAEQRDRILSIHSELEGYLRDNHAEKAVFFDAGDGVEGFENTAQQMFTNQLSLMDQIDLESTYEQLYIQLLADFADTVEVYGIDSNHSKWRNGKSNLGLPKDDWGRFIKRQLRKAFSMSDAYDHVSFAEPDDWERTMNVYVFGHGVGLMHGDQTNSVDAIPKWWAGQTHGSLPTADSEILLHGHFHHFIMRQTGRHRNGEQKFVIGAPPLDVGSSWHEATSGESSDPGLIVFQIDENGGFNFDSMTLLKGN